LVTPPKRVFCVHGEPAGLEAMRARLTGAGSWKVQVPEYLEEVELG
jgi:hypothetical protein